MLQQSSTESSDPAISVWVFIPFLEKLFKTGQFHHHIATSHIVRNIIYPASNKFTKHNKKIYLFLAGMVYTQALQLRVYMGLQLIMGLSMGQNKLQLKVQDLD